MFKLTKLFELVPCIVYEMEGFDAYDLCSVE